MWKTSCKCFFYWRQSCCFCLIAWLLQVVCLFVKLEQSKQRWCWWCGYCRSWFFAENSNFEIVCTQWKTMIFHENCTWPVYCALCSYSGAAHILQVKGAWKRNNFLEISRSFSRIFQCLELVVDHHGFILYSVAAGENMPILQSWNKIIESSVWWVGH